MDGKANKTATITLRINPRTKADLEYLVENLGMTITEAVNIFFAQMLKVGGLPFDVKAKDFSPDFNDETIEAMREALDINAGKIPAKRYHSARELFEANNAEIVANA